MLLNRQFKTPGQSITMRERCVAMDELTYLHGDHLGSASLATDAQGG